MPETWRLWSTIGDGKDEMSNMTRAPHPPLIEDSPQLVAHNPVGSVRDRMLAE